MTFSYNLLLNIGFFCIRAGTVTISRHPRTPRPQLSTGFPQVIHRHRSYPQVIHSDQYAQGSHKEAGRVSESMLADTYRHTWE